MLFCTPETKELALEVIKQNPDSIKLGNVDWKNFDDGFPDIFIRDAEHIRNKHVGFIACFNDKGGWVGWVGVAGAWMEIKWP